MYGTTWADLTKGDQSRVRRTATAIVSATIGLFENSLRAALAHEIMDMLHAERVKAQNVDDIPSQSSADRLDQVFDALLAGEDASRGKRIVSRLRSGGMRGTTWADLTECDQSRVRRTAAAISNDVIGLFESNQRAVVTSEFAQALGIPTEDIDLDHLLRSQAERLEKNC